MSNKLKLNLKNLSVEEIVEQLNSAELEYSNLRMDHNIKGLANGILIRNKRRDVARIKTEMRSRELGEMSKEELRGRSKIRNRRKG